MLGRDIKFEGCKGVRSLDLDNKSALSLLDKNSVMHHFFFFYGYTLSKAIRLSALPLFRCNVILDIR